MVNAVNLAPQVTSQWKWVQGRNCGDCTKCCTILPVRDPRLDKDHGVKCQHLTHKGCKIYANRPDNCRHWECGWRQGLGVDDIRRPDKAGYIIDTLADFVQCNPPDLPSFDQAMVVIWVDPKRPEAWRDDKALFKFFERWGTQGFGAIVRYDSKLSVCVFPPQITGADWFITPPQEAQLTEIDPHVKHAHAQAALDQWRGQ